MTLLHRADDDTLTRLATGARIEKDSPTLELIGALEELAAWVATLADDPPGAEAGRALGVARNDLFELIGQVAAPGTVLLAPAYGQRLAGLMDQMERGLPAAPARMLPGGAPRAGFAAIAHAVCRRAERRMVSHRDIDPATDSRHAVAYLNLLGDLLAQIARSANHAAGRTPPIFDRGVSLAGEPPLG